jgi:class 3 adenylate cyclase
VLVFEGDDYVGTPVNLAAKLCDLAEPQQFLAPAVLGEACPIGIEAHPVGDRRVPGFRELISLVAIDISRDAAGRHRRGLGEAVGKEVQRTPESD